MANPQERSRKSTRVARLAAVGGLAIAAIATVSPSAFASGTSGNTNGCVSTWGDTGSNGHCTAPHVTVTGNYSNYAVCGGLGDNQDSGWYYMTEGSYVDGWGQVDCTFSVSHSEIHFS